MIVPAWFSVVVMTYFDNGHSADPTQHHSPLSARGAARAAHRTGGGRFKTFQNWRCSRVSLSMRLRFRDQSRSAVFDQGARSLLSGVPEGQPRRRRGRLVCSSIVSHVVEHDRPLHEPAKQVVPGLRWQGHQRVHALAKRRGRGVRLRLLRGRYGGEAVSRADLRAVQFRRSLRARELLLGYPKDAKPEPAKSAPRDHCRPNATGFGVGRRIWRSLLHTYPALGARDVARAGHSTGRSPPSLRPLRYGGWQ